MSPSGLRTDPMAPAAAPAASAEEREARAKKLRQEASVANRIRAQLDHCNASLHERDMPSARAAFDMAFKLYEQARSRNLSISALTQRSIDAARTTLEREEVRAGIRSRRTAEEEAGARVMEAPPVRPPVRPRSAQPPEERIQQALLAGDRARAATILRASGARLSAERKRELHNTIETAPPEAMDVLRHGTERPLAALGLGNSVGSALCRTSVIKTYKQLALKLHPDKCEHPLASDATKVLNDAYRQAIALF